MSLRSQLCCFTGTIATKGKHNSPHPDPQTLCPAPNPSARVPQHRPEVVKVCRLRYIRLKRCGPPDKGENSMLNLYRIVGYGVNLAGARAVVRALGAALLLTVALYAAPAEAAWNGEQLVSGSSDAWEPFVAADRHSNNVYAVWFLPHGPSQCTGCPASGIQFTHSADNGQDLVDPSVLPLLCRGIKGSVRPHDPCGVQPGGRQPGARLRDVDGLECHCLQQVAEQRPYLDCRKDRVWSPVG